MQIVTGSGIGSSVFAIRSTYTNGDVFPQEIPSGDRAVMTLQKPDSTIRNPLVNGYRKPSGWSVTAGGYVGGTSAKLIAKVSTDNAILKERRNGNPYIVEQTVSGTRHAVVNIPQNKLNENELRMKVLNNVRGEVWDVAMTLAEIQGTANTLSNNLLRLARSLDSVKKRRPDNFYYLLTGRRRDNRRPTDKFLRESAGVYLEWKYGIMPTIYDIRGACKGLDMAQDGSLFDNPPLLVARSRISERFTGTSSYRFPTNSARLESIQIPFEGLHELHARCDYRVSGEALRGLNRFGIGLGTVGTVLFERTPFSFVLNMAIPIAELIKAWTALAGVDVVGYSETRYSSAKVVKGSTFAKWQPAAGSVLENHAFFTYEGLADYFEFTRTAYNKPPMPLPFIRNPVKVGNISTVLALFTQLRRPDVPK